MTKEMTPAEFLDYVEKLAKAATDKDVTDEQRTPLLAKFDEAIVAAKNAFGTMSKPGIPVEMKDDPFLQKPTEQMVTPPPPPQSMFKGLDAEPVVEGPWPKDLSHPDFLEERGELTKGDWGDDPTE
jgi:hypothetical protein